MHLHRRKAARPMPSYLPYLLALCVALGAAAGARVNLGFALLNAGRLQDAMLANGTLGRR